MRRLLRWIKRLFRRPPTVPAGNYTPAGLAEAVNDKIATLHKDDWLGEWRIGYDPATFTFVWRKVEP